MNKALKDLLDANLEHAKHFQDRFDHVQGSQEPDYVTICCSDSRVMQDHMWGNEHPGEVFTVANIGNRVSQKTRFGKVVSGDVLYPVEHTDTGTVIVIGHTGCGAVTATYKDVKDGVSEPDGIRHCIDQLKPIISEGVKELPEGLSESEEVNHLVEFNVDMQVDFLLKSGEIPEDTDVVGVVYDFQDVYSGERGHVQVVNINGNNNVEELREENSEFSDRINRLWN